MTDTTRWFAKHVKKLHLEPHDIVVVPDGRTAEAVGDAVQSSKLPFAVTIVIAPNGLTKFDKSHAQAILERISQGEK